MTLWVCGKRIEHDVNRLFDDKPKATTFLPVKNTDACGSTSNDQWQPAELR